MSALPFDAIHWRINPAGDCELRAAPVPLTWPAASDVREAVAYGPADATRIGALAVMGGALPAGGIDYASLRSYIRSRLLAEDSIRSRLADATAVYHHWPETACPQPCIVFSMRSARDSGIDTDQAHILTLTISCAGADAAVNEDLAGRAATVLSRMPFSTADWHGGVQLSRGGRNRRSSFIPPTWPITA